MGVRNTESTMYDGHEMLLESVRHVEGLRKNPISLDVLHGEGWLYLGMLHKRTLRVMQDEKTVMIGEKLNAHHYMLKGEVIEDGAVHFVAFDPCGEATSSAGCST